MGEISVGSKALDLAFELPATIIDRKEYLTSCFNKKYSEEQVRNIINTTPIKFGIDHKTLKCLAEESISFELWTATSVSAVFGLPGGWAAIPTSASDVAQFLSHEMRLIQKLAYLYGYPDFREANGKLSDEAKLVIMCFLGVMYAVKGAGKLIEEIAKHLSEKAVKEIAKAALTKTVWYPILKKIAEKFGYELTKKGLANFLGKAIPFIGGFISGGMTYYAFSRQADKLHRYISNNPVL